MIGSPGHNGTTGAHGALGPPGQTGQDGDRGASGSQGPAGPRGARGDSGWSGASGSRGPTGDRGYTGGRGAGGPPGPPGSTGAKGYKGPRGTALRGQKGQKGELGFCLPTFCKNCGCDGILHSPVRKRATELSDTSDSPGVVYTRWGENRCPKNSTRIYTGFLVGRQAASYLCLPSTSYHNNDGTHDFNDNMTVSLDKSEIPCSVCLAMGQTSIITIPVEVTCPSGWTTQYSGYLMTSSISQRSGPHHCLDFKGVSVDSNAWLAHTTEMDCTGSNCSNRVECAVCTL